MTTVAVIGLGAMGSRIAHRLIDAGHDVHVWNRTPSKTEALVAAGANAAESPAAAAGAADVVMTMVADPVALVAVSEGPDGVAAGVSARGIVVEMSTVGPAAITRLRGALRDEVELVDAPVLGSISEVEGGALRIFVGGTDDAYERMRPVFAALGEPLHAGPLGSGAAAKLVANSTLFGSLGVLGEALSLADALGLERDTAFEVLAGTPVGPQAERRRGALESGDFEKRFALSLASKDADLVVAAAEDAGVDAPLARAARGWLGGADAAGLGDEDYSRVLEHILRAAGKKPHP